MARFNVKAGQIPLTGGDSLYKSRIANAYNIYSTEMVSFTIQDIDEMVRFPSIAHAMSIVKALYATRDFTIAGPKQEIKDFLKLNLNMWWDKFLNDAMVAQEYGYQPFFIDWISRGGKYLIQDLIPMKPHSTIPVVDENGIFAGLEQQYNSGIKSEWKWFPPEQTFVYAYDMKWNDLTGRSRLIAVRYPYVVYKYIIEMANIFYSNFADPVKIAKAPSGKAPDGSGKTNMEKMNEKVQALDVGGSKIITLPSETDDKGEPRWDLKYLESQRDAATYKEYLLFLKKEITEGVLVPELAGSSGERGSYNLWEGQMALLAYKSDLDMAQLAFCIKKNIFNKLIYYNFTEADMDLYDLNFTKASKENRQLFGQVVQAGMQNGQAEPDWEQVSRITGLKITKNTADVAAQIAEKQAQGQQDNKPQAKGGQGGKMMKKDGEQMSLFPCGHQHLEKKVQRELTAAEKNVEFEKLNDIYDSSDEIQGKLQVILDGIRMKAIARSRGAITDSDIKRVSAFALDNKSEYIALYETELDKVFTDAFNLTKTELGLNKTPSIDVLEAQIMKAKGMASKQIGDIEYGVKGILLSAFNNKTNFEIVAQQINSFFKDYESRLKVGVDVSIQQFVDDARRDVADDPSVEFATWSAILDDKTCELCQYLDGMTVEVNSPEYNEFTPGNLHPEDRCIWVYTKAGEENPPEVNFEKPPADLIEKYMRI